MEGQPDDFSELRKAIEEGRTEKFAAHPEDETCAEDETGEGFEPPTGAKFSDSEDEPEEVEPSPDDHGLQRCSVAQPFKHNQT
jgi:hypothetical protein